MNAVSPPLEGWTLAEILDAPDQLVGLTLGEAFFKCVLQDPEVRVLAKELPGEEIQHASIIDEGQCPGIYVEYNWPLDVTANDLAYEFVRPILIDLDEPLPKPSVEIVRWCEVVVDRLCALLSLVSSGKLVASGTHVATGNLVSIDRYQWKRRGLLLDVRNSDIWDAQIHPPILRWTGLALQAGPMMNAAVGIEQRSSFAATDPGFHVKPTEPDDVRPSTVETPKSRKGIARVESSIKDLTERLLELMRKNPEKRITIEALWKEVRARWPNLSKNAFQKARADAIEQSGATAWAAGGAPKKSANRQSSN
jgi:hypothetical protein